MESLKDEVLRMHNCIEHVVKDTDSYQISLLKFEHPRDFIACSVETKGNCTQQDISEIFEAMTAFIKNNPESSPCYSLIDVTRTDAFTLQQLTMAANAFNSVKSYIQTRLVGTVVKVGEENYHDGIMSKAFKRLYTPVRPVVWYQKSGDCSNFITEWEAAI